MFEHRVCAPSVRLHAAWLLGFAVAGMLALSIGGCNTMSGMGRGCGSRGQRDAQHRRGYQEQDVGVGP
jgi:hypothetical protein